MKEIMHSLLSFCRIRSKRVDHYEGGCKRSLLLVYVVEEVLHMVVKAPSQDTECHVCGECRFLQTVIQMASPRIVRFNEQQDDVNVT